MKNLALMTVFNTQLWRWQVVNRAHCVNTVRPSADIDTKQCPLGARTAQGQAAVMTLTQGVTATTFVLPRLLVIRQLAGALWTSDTRHLAFDRVSRLYRSNSHDNDLVEEFTGRCLLDGFSLPRE